MLYESDINGLLSKWEAHLDSQPSEYKIGVRDCIYDLRCLMDKNHEEEALAQEAFEQTLKMDEEYWNDYFNNLTADGIFA